MALPVPIFRIQRVFHVGALEGRPSRSGSFEGDATSVSLCPRAWADLARRGGPCWRLDRGDAAFLDMTGMSANALDEIVSWAEAAGLAERAPVWRFSEWSDDLESELVHEFASAEEATEEAFDPNEVVEADGLRPTDRLVASRGAAASGADTSLTRDFAVMCWAERAGFDGVWWHEAFDPEILTAPRGCIFPARFEGFEAARVDWSDVPDDEDLLVDAHDSCEVEMRIEPDLPATPGGRRP